MGTGGGVGERDAWSARVETRECGHRAQAPRHSHGKKEGSSADTEMVSQTKGGRGQGMPWLNATSARAWRRGL